MVNVEIVIGITVGIIAIMATFFKLVFDYATLKATTTQILKEVLDLKKYLTLHDTRLDDHEKRLTTIEIGCQNNHKE